MIWSDLKEIDGQVRSVDLPLSSLSIESVPDEEQRTCRECQRYRLPRTELGSLGAIAGAGRKEPPADFPIVSAITAPRKPRGSVHLL